MARIPARAFAVPMAVLAILTASACGTDDAGKVAPKAADNGQIQLVDSTAQAAGLSGDGKATAASGASSAAPGSAAASGTTPPGGPPGGVAEPPAKWIQLSTNDSPIGKTVTEVRGFTLYRFDKDKADPSQTACTGQCAVTWPPVLIQPGGRVFVDGIKTAKIGGFRRPDGMVQVTIGGWPAYRFAKDTVPGDLNGQGVGGTWFAFKPNGAKNTSLVAATSAEPAKDDRTKTLTAKKTADGRQIVVDDGGATLYTRKSACDDACAARWRPVVADGERVTVSGVDTARVGTIRRAGGGTQLTMDGAALYRNAADKSTGVVIASVAEQGWSAAG